MPQFMVVSKVDGETGANFYDSLGEAENARMACECGMGGYAEVYTRVSDKDGDRYELLYS